MGGEGKGEKQSWKKTEIKAKSRGKSRKMVK